MKAFKDLGVSNKKVTGSFFDSFDKDGSGRISYEEFISALAMLQKGGNSSEALKFIFDCCDIDANGDISKEELRTLIHALMVTKENLSTTDSIEKSLILSSGPQNWQDRQYKKEKALSHSARHSHPSSGKRNQQDNDSIWDIYNKARLRNGESYTPSSITTVSIAPTSLQAGEGGSLQKQLEAEREQERLAEIYQEFPELKGQNLDSCLNSLSDVMSEQIFQSANRSSNQNISFQDFEQWAGKKSHESEVLFGLFSDFQVPDGEVIRVASTSEDFYNSDSIL